MTTPVDEDAPFAPEDDTFHAARDDPDWLETTWWSFNVPERKIGGWIHAGCHTNRQQVTWRMIVWGGGLGVDPGRMAYYRNVADAPLPADADLRDITFAAGGFSLKALKPMMDYALSYHDRGERFGLELEHRSVHPPQRFTPGEAPALHNPHFDQLGRLTGELVLDSERIPVDSWSVRDRTWGPRRNHHSIQSTPSDHQREHRVAQPGGPRWREIERERGRGRIQYIFGHSDDQTGFLSFVRPQDGDADGWSPLNVGWLLKDGVFHRLDKARSRMRNFRDPTTGWSAQMEVDLVDRTGRSMWAEGAAVSYICEHAAGANALMRWEYDGRIGWGEDQDGWRLDHFRKMLTALRAAR